MAFNTCQVCNPSPKAYFVQNGKNFICQNCKNSLKSYYTDEYLELIKMHLPMFEYFGQKVQFVLENSEAYTNPEMGYADRKWRMEDLIGNENKDGLLFSKEEKYKINMIDCYREIEGKKHYELCIVVNVKGGKDIYLFSDETNSFRKMTLEEFAEQIENGLVNLQGIQGIKQVLKSRKQQPDER